MLMSEWQFHLFHNVFQTFQQDTCIGQWSCHMMHQNSHMTDSSQSQIFHQHNLSQQWNTNQSLGSHSISKFSFIAVYNLASYDINWHTVQTYYIPVIWLNIPRSHLSPLFPAGHCSRQAPVTWSQVTPSGQEHSLSQPEPKKPDPHSTRKNNHYWSYRIIYCHLFKMFFNAN